jgi:hypothetical protein
VKDTLLAQCFYRLTRDRCSIETRGTTHIDGEVTTDGARSRGQGVGGAEEDTAGLDGVTALPDHGGNGTAQHVCIILWSAISRVFEDRSEWLAHTLNQTGEEGLLLQVGVVGLEVLLGGGDELQGDQLVARQTRSARIMIYRRRRDSVFLLLCRR